MSKIFVVEERGGEDQDGYEITTTVATFSNRKAAEYLASAIRYCYPYKNIDVIEVSPHASVKTLGTYLINTCDAYKDHLEQKALENK